MGITQDILRNAGSAATMTNGQTSYTDIRTFIFDTPPTSANDALAFIKSSYPIGAPGANSSSLDSVNIDQITPIAWNATLTYSTKSGTYTPDGGGNPPPVYTKKITYGKWSVTRVVEHDARPVYAGNPNSRKNIRNTAGDRFAPAFQVQKWFPQITVELNTSDGNSLDPIAFVGSVNKDTWEICGLRVPRFCAMLVDFAPSNKGDDGRYRTSWTFNLNFSKAPPGMTLAGETETGFIEWVLNAGLNKLDGGQRVPIYQNNEPVTSPVPLDELGAVLDGDYTPIYLDFMPHDVVDFNGVLPPFDEIQ